MTALTWTLFALRCHSIGTRCTILDVLIDAGANRQARDPTGLCAYDHARILKLDPETIERLNPFINARANGSSGLLDAIRNCNSDAAVKCLDQKVWPDVLDQMHQSPLALAIHKCVPEVLAKLVEVGFSPFASYASESSYVPSMACAFLRAGIDIGGFETTGRALELTFKAWINSRSSVVPSWTVIQWTRKALDLQCKAAACSDDMTSCPWGDTLVISALLDTPNCLRLCLRKPTILGTTPVDGAAWALYAAIRRGNVTMMEIVIGHGSNVIRTVIARPLDQRHFLASWWPWPCACDDTVHSLGSRSLLDYVQDLEMVSLCPSCEKLRHHYMTIGFDLNPYYDCYDENGEFIATGRQSSQDSSSVTRSNDTGTDKRKERHIYEMPGDMPTVKEGDGNALSENEAHANQVNVYNTLESPVEASSARRESHIAFNYDASP
jgi:hypothetical protein